MKKSFSILTVVVYHGLATLTGGREVGGCPPSRPAAGRAGGRAGLADRPTRTLASETSKTLSKPLVFEVPGPPKPPKWIKALIFIPKPLIKPYVFAEVGKRVWESG